VPAIPQIFARAGERIYEGGFTPGASLREILQVTDCRPFSACAGNGFCGMCRVRVEQGSPSAPTQAEILTLSKSMLARGIRLACQTRVHTNVRVEVLNPHPSTEWRTPEPASLHEPAEFVRKRGGATGWGVAVDMGTTHLTISLIDRKNGRRRAARTGFNRQNRVGADILTRLQGASESAENRSNAVQLARESVADALTDMCLAEGFNPHKISSVCIVGNSAMILLLLGGNPADLLDPGSWGRRPQIPRIPAAELAAAWNLLPDVDWIIPSLLFGFVGSDALAGVLATGMTERDETCAFVDFGTNSEMVLWHEGKLLVASAAGGPAFEGSGLGCGSPARPGAIHRVSRDGRGELHREVLGNRSPIGLCGSGLVDLLAVWVDAGVIDALGRFAVCPDRTSHRIFEDLPELELSRHDIDMLQRAKAAVGAGLRCLMNASGISPCDIHRIFIGGAFGRYLNLRSAKRIGLLPDLPDECFSLCGNTAIAGAELLLSRKNPASEWEKISRATTGVNLATDPAFEFCFLESLFLQGWQ
jgi:uncharacterized 2Fe-2S/4Fe-4S cluster protein (DUF4445 family)